MKWVRKDVRSGLINSYQEERVLSKLVAIPRVKWEEELLLSWYLLICIFIGHLNLIEKQTNETHFLQLWCLVDADKTKKYESSSCCINTPIERRGNTMWFLRVFMKNVSALKGRNYYFSTFFPPPSIFWLFCFFTEKIHYVRRNRQVNLFFFCQAKWSGLFARPARPFHQVSSRELKKF